MSTKLTHVCVCAVGVAFMLAGAASAKFDPAEAMGVWLFDDGDGNTVEDISPNGFDGSLNDAPEWVDGKFGTALSFDGVDDHVEMPDPINVNDATHTISLWVNPGPGPQKSYADMLGNHTGDVKGYDIEQRVDETNKFYHGMGVGGAWQGGAPPVRPATQLETGVWQHLVLTRDGATIRHYLNGEITVDYQIDAAATDPSEGNLRFGLSQCCAGREFQGMLDEIVIVDRTLSRAEIAELAEGIEAAMTVSSKDKLATTWAGMKSAY